MKNTAQLPESFGHLEEWVDTWVLSDSAARREQRHQTPFSEIRAFYEAMLPEAPRILERLGQCPLGGLDARHERLLKLMLSLAEVGPAVEWYGQGPVVDGFAPDRFMCTLTLSDTQVQG